MVPAAQVAGTGCACLSWDAYQCAVLDALGLALYAPVRGAAAQGAVAGASLGDIANAMTDAMTDAMTSPMGAPMLARLALAAGIQAEALQHYPDVLAAGLQLQGNAAAKRALWARLRGLRRDARCARQ